MGLIIILLSVCPDKKERTKRNEHVGMQKDANFTVLSTTLLIGLNIKFYKIFAKKQLSNVLLTKSHLSLSNTEILCDQLHVK